MTRIHHPNRRRVLKTIGAAGIGSLALSGNTAAHRGGLQRELATVRSATARYNDPANAYADGYVALNDEREVIPLEDVVDEGHTVCGMGIHFANLNFIGGPPSLTEPAVLAYGVDEEDNLVLGAVEWVVSKQVSPSEPDLFDHDNGKEVWQEDSPFRGVWSLHAWVHTHNPEGVFHPTNPRHLFAHPEWCENNGGHH